MDHFNYREGSLFCEDVEVAEIAAQAGSPAYIYSSATLLHHYNEFVSAFEELQPSVCFAVKSLLNIHVLKLLAEAGSGFDVTSGGELARALEAGCEPGKIVFAGVGKTDAEISQAVDAGIGLFNVESEEEFENISRLAKAAGTQAHATLRVNPDVFDPKTHTYTVTGKKGTKFGVDIDRAGAFIEKHSCDENVILDGIHLHIGSPIYSPEPYVKAIEKALVLIDQLAEKGVVIKSLDLGGGYAADYEQGASPSAKDYASEIVPLLKGRGLNIVLEPGRQISCNAGILIAQVQYAKQGGGRNFVIVDASMTDLIRPALYGSEHFIYPTRLGEGAEIPSRRMDFSPAGGVKVDIVGGVCESSDFLGKDRLLPPLGRGDLLAVFSAGAYGFVLASQYNSRPRCPEILVSGDTWRVIRRRETYDDILACERDVD